MNVKQDGYNTCFFVPVNAEIAASMLHISLDLARDWNNWSVQPEVVKTLCRFVDLISFKLVTRGCTRNWKMATPRPVHRKLLNNNYNSLPLRGRAKLLLRSGVLQALQYWSVALWEREKGKRCCLKFDFAKLCSEILFCYNSLCYIFDMTFHVLWAGGDHALFRNMTGKRLIGRLILRLIFRLIGFQPKP